MTDDFLGLGLDDSQPRDLRAEPQGQIPPQPQPQPQSQSQSSPELQPQQAVSDKKFFKKQLLTVSLFILVGAAAVSAGTYFYLQKNPEEVVKTAVSKTAEVNSFHYDINLKFDSQAGFADSKNFLRALPALLALVLPDGETGYPASTLAPDSISSRADIKASGDMEIIDNKKTQITCDLSGQMEFSDIIFNFASEIKFKGEDVYIKIKKFPLLDLLGLGSADVEEQIKNKWIKINLKEATQQFGVDESEVTEAVLNEQQIAKIRKIISEADIFDVEKDFGKEKIGGIKVYHYGTRVNQEEYQKMFIEIYKIIVSEVDGINDADIVFLEKDIKESFDATKEAKAELWIGTNDYLIYKIVADVVLSQEEEVYGDRKIKNDITFNLLAEFSDFNKPVEIMVSEDSVSLADISEKIFGDLRKGGQDARRIADIRQLQLASELYFDANDAYPKANSWKELEGALVPEFISVIPKDPLTNDYEGAIYCHKNNGKSYIFGIKLLENIDSDILKTDLDGNQNCSAGTVNCDDPVYCVEP